MSQDDPNKDEALFIGLVSMLSQGALQHLGKIADPSTGKAEKNLEGARISIDLLVMIKNKTRGNLSADEEKFLSSTLAHLQLNYVEESQKKDS